MPTSLTLWCSGESAVAVITSIMFNVLRFDTTGCSGVFQAWWLLYPLLRCSTPSTLLLHTCSSFSSESIIILLLMQQPLPEGLIFQHLPVCMKKKQFVQIGEWLYFVDTWDPWPNTAEIGPHQATSGLVSSLTKASLSWVTSSIFHLPSWTTIVKEKKGTLLSLSTVHFGTVSEHFWTCSILFYFIICLLYWLPSVHSNNHNFISFKSTAQIPFISKLFQSLALQFSLRH